MASFTQIKELEHLRKDQRYESKRQKKYNVDHEYRGGVLQLIM